MNRPEPFCTCFKHPNECTCYLLTEANALEPTPLPFSGYQKNGSEMNMTHAMALSDRNLSEAPFHSDQQYFRIENFQHATQTSEPSEHFSIRDQGQKNKLPDTRHTSEYPPHECAAHWKSRKMIPSSTQKEWLGQHHGWQLQCSASSDYFSMPNQASDQSKSYELIDPSRSLCSLLDTQIQEIQEKMAELKKQIQGAKRSVQSCNNGIESKSNSSMPSESSFLSAVSKQENLLKADTNHFGPVVKNIWRDVNYPKRPLTAYNIFFQHERARLLGLEPLSVDNSDAIHAPQTERQSKRGRKKRKPHNKLGFQEMAQIISRAWKMLDEPTRATYQALADRDRERYAFEKDEYIKEKRLKREGKAGS